MKRFFHSLLAVLFVAFVGSVILNPKAEALPYYDGVSRPLVIAHQGGDGAVPGNTLFAFEWAVETGADVLEMDAHLTSDGQIVLIHDEDVERTTDGVGLVEEMTLAQVQQLDAGYDWSADDGATFPFRGLGIRIPTLVEVFTAFPDMRYVIEIKKTTAPLADPLCTLIREYDMQDKVAVGSFHDTAMRDFRAACPEVVTSASRTEVRNYVILGKAFLWGFVAPEYESIQPPWNPDDSLGIQIMTERFIRESHGKNLRVEPWTVDDPDLMRQYIAWGVDGIITDRPDLMIEVLKESAP